MLKMSVSTINWMQLKYKTVESIICIIYKQLWLSVKFINVQKLACGNSIPTSESGQGNVLQPGDSSRGIKQLYLHNFIA